MKKVLIRDAGVQREAEAGEVGALVMPTAVVRNATAGALALTAAMIAPGTAFVRTGGGGAGFADTLPLNAAMVAAFAEMQVGDSYVMNYINRTGQIATLTASASFTVVAAGGTTIGVGVDCNIRITRSTATAWTAEII